MFLKTINWLFTTELQCGSFWGRQMPPEKRVPPAFLPGVSKIHKDVHSDFSGVSSNKRLIKFVPSYTTLSNRVVPTQNVKF